MDQTSPAWRSQVQPIPDFLKTSGGGSASQGNTLPGQTSTTPPIGNLPQQNISFQKHAFILMLLGMCVLIILSFLVGFLLGAKTFLPRAEAPPVSNAQATHILPPVHIPSENTLGAWGITEPTALVSLENKLPQGADQFLRNELEHARHQLNQRAAPAHPSPTHPAMMVGAPPPTMPPPPTSQLVAAPSAPPMRPASALPLNPMTPLAPTSTATYTLQVGAFNDGDKALQAANLYNQQGHPAFVVKSWGDKGRLWYYVRMGQFKTAHDANAQALKMVKDYHMSAMVVEQKPGDVRL